MKLIATFFLFLLPFFLAGQITGTVTEANTGEPLIAANVFVVGTERGTATDVQGNYTIDAQPGEQLEFTYTGYQTQLIRVRDRTVIDVEMRPGTDLEEVVVIGYGTRAKSDLTGAVSSVESEEIVRIPTASVEQALQGRVAGVQVTPASGAPGAGAIIRIRGVGTLGNASPLFVVDGMLLDDINFLDPNDVQSIEVLKDASATAIYGSRGANGVIIVTTKRGQQDSERAQFQLNSYYGVQSLAHKIDLVNADQFATLANEIATNEGTGLPFPDTTQTFGAGTDWQDVIYRDASIQSHQLSATGGSERSTYYLAANFFQQEGIIEGSEFQRFTLRLNNTYQPADNVRLGHNLSLVRRDEEFAAGVVANAYRADPTVPLRDTLGNFGNTSIRASVGNPEAQIAFNNNGGFGTRAVGNLYAEGDFLDGFTFRTNFGLDLDRFQSKNFVPEFFVSSIQFNDETRLSLANRRTESWLWENTLTYAKAFGEKHDLDLLAGITAQEFYFEEFGGSRNGIPGDSDELFFLSSGEIEGQTNFNNAFEWSLLSYLFRANYVYDGRLLFTASFRADGSSKFGVNNRFGYFPSFAVGYNFWEEGFVANTPWFDNLKLRASWGQVGNEKIGAYAGRAVVTSNLNAVFGLVPTLDFGAGIITLANPDIRWEETTQLDVGVEMAFFNYRLTAELDFYDRLTDGILVAVPIPEYVGSANFPIVNAAEVRNAGVDLNLQWRDRVSNDFNYNFGLIVGAVDNTVEALGQGNEAIFGGDLGVGGQLGTRTVVGQPIGAFYGYQTDGVFQTAEEVAAGPTLGNQQPGDLRFVDQNGDGIITTDDRTEIGSPLPDFTFGFNLGFELKGLDFVADFNGVAGNEIINAKRIARFGTYNFETVFLDRWTGEGTSNTEPRITNGGVNYNFSDRFVEDGSFLRLRNVTLGYSLPRTVLERVRLSQLRVYAAGTNLVTWTTYSGYSPEVADGSVIGVGIDRGIYPIARTVTVGVQVGF